MITIRTDYGTRAKDLVIERYKNATTVIGLCEGLTEEIQDLEDAVSQVLNETHNIDTAVGVYLDDIGDIVGEYRDGRDDTSYRQSIIQRIATNISGGQPEILLSIGQLFTGSTHIDYLPIYPAGLMLTFHEGVITDSIIEKLFNAVAAGVRMTVISSPAVPLVFDGDPAGDVLSEDGDTFGGEFSEVLTDV